ncbi:unnamed protein product [Malus baccata var. baccata]
MARLSWIPTALFVILALMTFAIDIALTGGHGSPPSKGTYYLDMFSLTIPQNFLTTNCPKACKHRCSATSHKKPCMFFCEKWCAKCLCVPSGTHGHKENCPCYNYWKAKEAGRPKCKCP